MGPEAQYILEALWRAAQALGSMISVLHWEVAVVLVTTLTLGFWITLALGFVLRREVENWVKE